MFKKFLDVIRKREEYRAALILSPSVIFLFVFFFLPLIIVLVFSFGERGPHGEILFDWTIENYIRFFDPLFFGIFLRSFQIALLTTIICLLVGYPLAYYIAVKIKERKYLALMFVMLPFWTSFLIRTYAWIVILRSEGVVNVFLMSLGVIDQPLKLLYTRGSVILGLVYGYLPFMVLPLYASIEKLDLSMLEAAEDLGATKFWTFIKVTLPLTLPGIMAGSILVFIPTIGEFVIPDLLGGAKNMMIGNLIQNLFLKTRDWAFGSATSLVVMAIVLVAIQIYMKFVGTEEF